MRCILTWRRYMVRGKLAGMPDWLRNLLREIRPNALWDIIKWMFLFGLAAVSIGLPSLSGLPSGILTNLAIFLIGLVLIIAAWIGQTRRYKKKLRSIHAIENLTYLLNRADNLHTKLNSGQSISGEVIQYFDDWANAEVNRLKNQEILYSYYEDGFPPRNEQKAWLDSHRKRLRTAIEKLKSVEPDKQLPYNTAQELSEKAEAEPNLELETMLVYTGQDDKGVFREDKNIEYQAAVIQFLNKAIKGRRVPSFDHVKAHIKYQAIGSDEIHNINAGTWMRKEYNFVPLRVGEWRRLIVALRTEKGELFLAVQNEYENDECFERLFFVKLTSEKYRVNVELVDIDSSEPIGDFKFDLKLKPTFSLKPIDPLTNENRINQLTAFHVEGEQILSMCAYEKHIPLDQEAYDWKSRVIGFLLRDLGEKYMWRFCDLAKDKIVRYPDPCIDDVRPFVDHIHTHLVRLSEIIEELRKSRDSL